MPTDLDIEQLSQVARCRACVSSRRETPMSVSCQVLDGEVSCAIERIQRHTKRLMEAGFRCDGPTEAKRAEAGQQKTPA